VTKTYDARLGTRITTSVDARLRQLALVRHRRLSHVLDDKLDAALPAAEDLTAQLARLASVEPEIPVTAADPHAAAGEQPSGHRDGDRGSVRPPEAEVISIRLPGRDISDRAQAWLRNAMIALAVLAAAAAAVSWDAQAAQISERSLPRPGCQDRPVARAHARTSAVERSGASGACASPVTAAAAHGASRSIEAVSCRTMRGRPGTGRSIPRRAGGPRRTRPARWVSGSGVRRDRRRPARAEPNPT